MRRIAYHDNNGRLWIVLPAINRAGDKSFEVAGFTEADAEKRAWDRLMELAARGDVSLSSDPVWLEESALPPDRTFRDAWKLNGSAVEHDMDRVKSIAHGKRRTARTMAFTPHDAIVSLNIPGQDMAAAEKTRVKIRAADSACQSAIEAADTVEQVKAALAAFGE